MIKHFQSLSSFSRLELQSLIDRSHFFSQQDKNSDEIYQILKNKIIANVFFEASTRTRCSFEIAAKRLGAEVVNFSPENSSVKKGETLYDTIKTLESLDVDAIVLRHSDDHVFDYLQGRIQVPIINAGAGKFEHPSQGLLDLLTIKQEFGKLGGLCVGICGDIKHSRVAASLMIAAEKFGLELFLCGPEELVPKNTNFKVIDHFDDLLPKVDVIMMLRIQLERHSNLNLNEVSYNSEYGLTIRRLGMLNNNAIVLHPGPFNRGVEIADSIVEHPKSRIFKQMKNGVFARMAILESVLGRRIE
jgi:aspartate carbamoyltransferase catalytic subunit